MFRLIKSHIYKQLFIHTQMNMPGNPNQMSMGLNTNQFDTLGTRMQGHVLNPQPQQQLQSHLQHQQQTTNPNLMSGKGQRSMSPQVQHHGVMGSNQSQIQQTLPASNNLVSMASRSSTDSLVSSVQSTVANTSSIQTSIDMVSCVY